MQEMVSQMQGLMNTVQQQAQVIAQLQAAQTKGAGKGADSTRLGIDVKRLGQPDKFDAQTPSSATGALCSSRMSQLETQKWERCFERRN